MQINEINHKIAKIELRKRKKGTRNGLNNGFY